MSARPLDLYQNAAALTYILRALVRMHSVLMA